MDCEYGYLKKTEGKDGEHCDVFIGPHPESELVFVIDQVNESGRFDEHKICLGWTNEKEAREGYLANYPSGWNGLGAIKAMRMDDFKKWIHSDGTSKRIECQTFSYIDDQGHYRNDISDIIIQQSTQGMADAAKHKNEKEFAKEAERLAQEKKRRLMLAHMMIDHDGCYSNYESAEFDALPESAKRAAFANMDKGGGGKSGGSRRDGAGVKAKNPLVNGQGKLEQQPKVNSHGKLDASNLKSPKVEVSRHGKLASPELAPKAEVSREGKLDAPKVEISPEGKFKPESERPKNRADRREARRQAGGGKTEKYDAAKDRTGHSLYKIVSRMGGISRSSAEAYGIKDLMENGMSGLLPKSGGKGLDEIATALELEGDIKVPEGMDGGGYLLGLIKEKRKSLHADLENEYKAMEKKYHQEIEHARAAGLDQSTCESLVRSGEAAGFAEGQTSDAWSNLGDAYEGGGGTEADQPITSETGELIPFAEPVDGDDHVVSTIKKSFAGNRDSLE
jgi:hypothetical protein